ncbi:hypothetical protein [Polyangium aurulentum]|uniref:hypothetical protein n=1 Tax=Polyangium aurulentum TaxID=2567896 RepID=UPI00146CB9DF|nr:hypothetical protein [Polyangium aurulentum]UQA61626.1 hypothetical protein E8A73_014605 [Polyangium aurulentum]
MILPRPLLPALPLVLAACAGQAPPPADPSPARAANPSPPAAPAQVAAEEAPARSDEPPAVVVLRGRVNSLRMSWTNAERLLRATGGPPLPLSPDLLAMGMLGPAVAGVVDLDQPTDIAFFGERVDRFAVAVRVDQRAAPRLRQRFKLAPRKGMLHIEAVLGDEPDQEGGLPACAFVEDEDDAVRAVCASDEELLDLAGLYLARTQARAAQRGDMRLELNFSHFLPIIEREQQATPPKDRGEKAGQRMGKELLEDIGRVAFVGSWGRNEIEAEVEVGFPQPRAGLSLAMLSRPAASTPPPPAYMRLPKDASLALYAHGDGRALVPLRELVIGTIRDGLIEEGYDADLVKTMSDKAAGLFFTGGPLVAAAGMDRSRAEGAFAAWGKDATKGREGAFRALRAWTVFGVEEPAERWIHGLEELVKIGDEIDRRKIAAGKGGAAGASAKGADPKKPEESRERTTILKVAPPKGLPKGTLHMEMRSRPRAKDAPPPHTRHVYVVPDGSLTWLALGEDEAEVLTHLRASLEGAPARTIASMPELEWTRVAGATAGGFVTVAGANLLFTDDERDSDLAKAQATLAQLGAMPSRGDTVIPWLVTSEDMPPQGTRLRVQARLPIAAIADIASIFKP